MNVLLQFLLLIVPSGVSSQIEWGKLRQLLRGLDLDSAKFIITGEIGHLSGLKLDLVLLL